MQTYKDIVFIVLDQVKVLSDDTVWEPEHVVSILNKNRSLIIKQRYLDKKKEVPVQFYQRLKVQIEPAPGINLYKSTSKIPWIIDNRLVGSYSRVSFDGVGSNQINLTTPTRFASLGYNKWTKDLAFVTLDLDGFMYMRHARNNPNIAQTNSFFYFDTVIENPIDINDFNGVILSDYMDTVFPSDEACNQAVIELTINELTRAIQMPRDNENNANDDINYSNSKNGQVQ